MADSDVVFSDANSKSEVALFGLKISQKLANFLKFFLIIICAVFCWLAHQKGKAQTKPSALFFMEENSSTNSVVPGDITKKPRE